MFISGLLFAHGAKLRLRDATDIDLDVFGIDGAYVNRVNLESYNRGLQWMLFEVLLKCNS